MDAVTPPFEATPFLSTIGRGKRILSCRKGRPVFSQGDAANAVYYVKDGQVKLSVVNEQGKEAIIAILNRGDFFGEGCIGVQPIRISTATATTACSVMEIDKREMVRVLRKDSKFSDLFMKHMLSRNARIEADLIDQLFNSTEKRLARILLLLANYGSERKAEIEIPKISQQTLASMVGTTRARVNFFMNKFRKMGFIRYNGSVIVHKSLLRILLFD